MIDIWIRTIILQSDGTGNRFVGTTYANQSHDVWDAIDNHGFVYNTTSEYYTARVLHSFRFFEPLSLKRRWFIAGMFSQIGE